VEILKALASKTFHVKLEEKLVDLLAKHATKDLTIVEAVTILEVFRIGRITLALLDKRQCKEASEG